MKNIFLIIISLFTLFISSHSEAQTRDRDPNDGKGKAIVGEGPHHSQSGPQPTPPAAAVQEADSPISPCEIPAHTEIIHFPMKSWEKGSELTKTVQETIDTVKKGAGDTIAFFENLVNRDNTSDTNTDNQSPSIVEKIAMSQFVLAQLIQKNHRPYVFHEFVGEIQDVRDLNDLMVQDLNTIQIPDQLPKHNDRNMTHLFQLVKQQFPDGIPGQYIELDDNQKYTLAIVGGVHILFFLGELPIIFPSIPQEDFQRMWEDNFSNCQTNLSILNMCSFSNHFSQMLRAEKISMAVNSFLNISPHKADNEYPSIILAYNGEYDLSSYFQDRSFYRIPDECVLPKTE